MGERTTSTQGALVAVEATRGTAPTSAADYIRLRAMGFELNSNPEIDTFKPQGQKYATVVTLLREYSAGSLSGRPTYTEIVYPLASLLTSPEITAAAGTTSAASGSRVMTDGTHWFYRPRAADADSYETLTAYMGSIVRAHRATFGVVTDFEMSVGVSETSLSGSMVGNAIEDGVAIPGNEVQSVTVDATGGTFTLTFDGQTTSAIAYNATAAVVQAALEALSNIPTDGVQVTKTTSADPDHVWRVQFGGALGATNVAEMTASAASLTGGASTAVIATVTGGASIATVALKQILPGHVCVYAYDSAQTDISDTTNETATYRLGRLHSVVWRLSGRFNPYNVIDCSTDGIAAMIEGDPTLEMELRMQANEQGMGYLSTMRTGATKFVRIKATGDAIDDGGSDDFEFTLDFAGKVSASQDFGDDDGVYAVGWTLTGVPELTNGGPLEIAIVNNVTSL